MPSASNDHFHFLTNPPMGGGPIGAAFRTIGAVGSIPTVAELFEEIGEG